MMPPAQWQTLLKWIAFPERFGRPLAYFPEFNEAYRGCLLGLAVGNVLGVPVEGWSKEQIFHTYPQGIQAPDPRERFREWDDDVAQSIILARALLEGDSLNLDILARELVAWKRASGRGIGILTARVLNAIEAGEAPLEAARRIWEQSGKQSAGNGAVMRCAPVALRWWRRPEKLVEQSLLSAQVTHADPRCQWSTVAVTASMAVLLHKTQVDLPSLAAALREAGAPETVAQAVKEANECTLQQLQLGTTAIGYTLKAMQVALWAARAEGSFLELILRVINEGGDTDTNGAVAGAVLGLRQGEKAIPGEWLNALPDAKALEELAEDLLKKALAEK